MSPSPGRRGDQGTVLLRLFLGVMGHISSPRFGEAFDRMVPLLVELSERETGMEHIETVLRYICNTSDASSGRHPAPSLGNCSKVSFSKNSVSIRT